MSDRYNTQTKSGGGVLSGIVPRTEYVVEKATGERVGEVTRWDWQNAGDKIAAGEWEPYDDDDDD